MRQSELKEENNCEKTKREENKDCDIMILIRDTNLGDENQAQTSENLIEGNQKESSLKAHDLERGETIYSNSHENNF